MHSQPQHKRLNSIPSTTNIVLAKNFDPTASTSSFNNINNNNNIINTKKLQQKKMLSLLIKQYDPARLLNQVKQQDDQAIQKEKKKIKMNKNLDIMPKINKTNATIDVRKSSTKPFQSKSQVKKLNQVKISDDFIKSTIPQNINLKTIQLERELLRKGRQPTLISKQSVIKRQSESLPSSTTVMRKNHNSDYDLTPPKVKIMSLKEKKEQEDRQLQEKHTQIFDIVGKAMKIARNDKITLFQENQEKGATLMNFSKNTKQNLEIKTEQQKMAEDSAEMQQFFSSTANQFTKIFGSKKKEVDKKQLKQGIKRSKQSKFMRKYLNIREMESCLGNSQFANGSQSNENVPKGCKYLNIQIYIKKHQYHQAIKNNVFPKYPFQHKNSYEFIKSAKIGDTRQLQKLLDAQPQLVHDFDYVHQTAVHWAAKRNTVDILKILLTNGGNPNLQDMGGRTPLFLASKLGCLASVKMLLAHRAKPNIRADSGQSPIDVAFNHKVKSFLMKARSLQIFSQFAPKQDRQKAWREQGLKFFEEQSLDQLPEFIR